MSGSCIPLKRECLSRQLIHLFENYHNACCIRDSEARFVYINPEMGKLLGLSPSFIIEGKLLAEVPHWLNVFDNEFKQYDKSVMDSGVSVTLLVTSVFGRDNDIKPYIFNIAPFFDDDGNIVGTLSEAKHCLFFSTLQFINGKFPGRLTNHLPDNNFTDRELEIIFFSYHGLSSKEIAVRLGLSHRTVENRLCSLYQRADVHSIHQFKEFCKDLDLDHYVPMAYMQPNIIQIDGHDNA